VCVCVCAYVEQMIVERENSIASITSLDGCAFFAYFVPHLHFSPVLSVELQIQINYVSETCLLSVCARVFVSMCVCVVYPG